MSKFRLWLLAHGLEFQGGEPESTPNRSNKGNVFRHMVIVINHRYIGVDIMVNPFKGVYADELDTPHAEIAAQYKQDAE